MRKSKQKLTACEIKQIQLKLLEDFHEFCISKNLKYSLCGGTLLGAVRHKGYIPWDDDIDVMMPRRDYQKMLELYYSDEFTLYHYAKQKSYMMSFAKLCDNRTIVEEGTVYESDYGVDIDIFPLDFFPDSIEESREWSKHLDLLKNIRTIKNMTWSVQRSFLKNVSALFLRTLLLPISMKWIVRRVDLLAQKYACKTDGHWGNMTNGYGMKERVPMAKHIVEIEFEGQYYNAIENYDVYLTSLFHNYMTPPPVEKQVSTHKKFKVYWRE